MDLLLPSTGLLFWMSITFFVVLFILWKWGFPAIVNMVEERKSFIDESLKRAHEANDRLTNIQKDAEVILQNAREKQAKILKEADDMRTAIITKAQQSAKVESTKIVDEARQQIVVEKQNAINDIRSQVAELSVKIAEKILQEKLSSDEKQMKLIDNMLNDISVEKNN